MVNNDKPPLVSVVMATYNEPVVFITAAIESICQQTYRCLELLIVDDSTQIDTIHAINSFAEKDPRIKVIRENQRMGFVHALNVGLLQSKGSFIARIDGDDVACKDRIAKQIKYMTQHPEIDVLGGAMNIIDENGNITSVRRYPKKGLKLRLWMIFRNPLGHPTILMKSDIINHGFLYDETMCHGCEDLELWFRLRNNGYCLQNMNDILIHYRVNSNMAHKREKDKYENIKARLKNFSIRHLLGDTAAIIFFIIRSLIPTPLISWFYEKENAQNYR